MDSIALCFLVVEATALEEGIDFGVAAHEVAEEDGRMFGAAFAEDFVAEGFSRGLVEDALFLELGKDIGIKHLGPLVAIVARRIASGKDMGEGSAGVGARDSGEQLLHVEALEILNGTFDGLGDGVEAEVGQTQAQLTDTEPSGEVFLSSPDFLDIIQWDGGSGLVVAGEGVEKLGLVAPILHHL